MIQEDTRRLQWACRRGMLELDVLLGNFLSEAYPALSADEKARFLSLLEQPDPLLFSWLMGHEIPTNAEFLPIVAKIRSHAKTRFRS